MTNYFVKYGKKLLEIALTEISILKSINKILFEKKKTHGINRVSDESMMRVSEDMYLFFYKRVLRESGPLNSSHLSGL